MQCKRLGLGLELGPGMGDMGVGGKGSVARRRVALYRGVLRWKEREAVALTYRDGRANSVHST